MSENIKPEVVENLKSETLNNIMKGTRHTHTFNVDFSHIDPNFVGSITVRRPSLMDHVQIGVKRTQLLGGVPVVDTFTDNIATMVATLDTVVSTTPEWFNVFSPDLDYDILEDVYKQYVKWYNSFRGATGETNPKGDSTDQRSDNQVEDNEGVQGITD